MKTSWKWELTIGSFDTDVHDTGGGLPSHSSAQTQAQVLFLGRGWKLFWGSNYIIPKSAIKFLRHFFLCHV